VADEIGEALNNGGHQLAGDGTLVRCLCHCSIMGLDDERPRRQGQQQAGSA
jgi:hypothetical protein